MTNININYHISHSTEHGDCATIVGQISPPEDGQKILVVSLEVDGIELLPSFRADFTSDSAPAELPEVKVFNPLPGRSYQFTLLVYEHDSIHRHETSLTLAP